MKTATTLLILLQVVGAFEYPRFFERGLCLLPKNGYWTSTQRFEKYDILDLSPLQFRTYSDHSQCLDEVIPPEEKEEEPKEEFEFTLWNGTKHEEAPTPSPTTAATTRPWDPDTPQFLQLLFFKPRFNRQVKLTDSLIGRDDAICCSDISVHLGHCRKDEIGKLILNRNLFDGEERLIEVPLNFEGETFQFDEKIEIAESNEYTILIANCNYGGTNVQLLPDPNLKKHPNNHRSQYLGFVLYYAFLAVYTASLFIAYARSLFRKNRESRHPMQKYLFVIMLVAFDDFAFRAFAFRALDAGPNWVWSKLFIYTAVAFPVLKRGMSMCLGILIAKGWGVIDQNIARSIAQIINLGVVYTGLVAFRDYMSVQSFDLMVPLDGDYDFPLFSNVAAIVTVIVHTMDILIAIWMVYCLQVTIRQLREEENEDQLKNYRKLRLLVLVSMLIAAPWWIIRLLARVEGNRVVSSDTGTFIWAAIIHLIYLVVLTNVSVLWRPTPSSQQPDVEKPHPRRSDESTQESSTLLTTRV